MTSIRVFKHPSGNDFCLMYGEHDVFELRWTMQPASAGDEPVWTFEPVELDAVPDGWIEMLPHPTMEDRMPHAKLQLDPTDELLLRRIPTEPGAGERFEIMATELDGNSSAVIELSAQQLQAIRELRPQDPPAPVGPHTLQWYAFGETKEQTGAYFDLVAEARRRVGHPQISDVRIVDSSGATVWRPDNR